MPRFVVLRHESHGPEGPDLHWDFMLECKRVLRTWALGSEPTGRVQIEARPLADHRLAYLNYEGPVSGDRGNVARWDAGDYELLSETPNAMIIQLHGGRLEGQATLWRVPETPQRWVFTFSE